MFLRTKIVTPIPKPFWEEIVICNCILFETFSYCFLDHNFRIYIPIRTSSMRVVIPFNHFFLEFLSYIKVVISKFYLSLGLKSLANNGKFNIYSEEIYFHKEVDFLKEYLVLIKVS